MKKWIISLNNQTVIDRRIAACIGYFDGIHLGHKALIDKAVSIASQKNLESALITFDPDPWVTVKGAQFVQHLNTMEEREALAEAYGIQNWIVLDFTKEMSRLSPLEFIRCLMRCNIDTLVCGFDYHYGALGKGNTESLIEDSKGCFNVVVIDSVDEGGEKISSSRITRLIQNGEIEQANKLLNYSYSISGPIINGRHQGRNIGFPTANMRVDREYILPKNGVYAGYMIKDQKKYPCMINIGHNPTFNFTEQTSVEAHIFDFDEELYGQTVRFAFVKMIRPEKKFSSVEQLVEQLTHDCIESKELLK